MKTEKAVKTLRIWRILGDGREGNNHTLTGEEPKQEVKIRRISKIRKPKCKQELVGFFFVDQIKISHSFEHRGERLETNNTVYTNYSLAHFPNATVITLRRLKFKLGVKKILFIKGQKNLDYSIYLLEELIKNMTRCKVQHVLAFDESIGNLLPCTNIRRVNGGISAEVVNVREVRMCFM